MSSSASDDGSNNAAPIACTTRPLISSHADGATPHSREPIVNTTRPSRKILRRPDRSAMRPAPSNNAPNTTLYAASTHERVAVDTSGNDRLIDGKATFTIDRSSATMNPAATVTAEDRPGNLCTCALCHEISMPERVSSCNAKC